MVATDPAAIRDGNVAVVRRFFERLQALETNGFIDGFLDLWTEDSMQDMPFAPAGFPSRLEGKPAIRRQYEGMPKAYTRMAFPELTVFPMLDPNFVVVEYRGEIDLAVGGKYNNHYCGIFYLRDGKIARFREYFNPIVLAESFGGENLAETFGLDPR